MPIQIECQDCGGVVTLEHANCIVTGLSCPDCRPDLYEPPDDVYPYWVHKASDGKVISATSLTVAEMVDASF